MSSSSSIIIALLISFLHTYQSIVQCNRVDRFYDTKLTTYIVHVRPISVIDASDSLETYYKSFLPTTTKESTKNRLMYSYTEVFSGFAARLADHEVKEMARKEGFVRAYRDKIIPLHTTHTPTFLGLQSGPNGGIWNASSFGERVVIGVLDTGIMLDHPSFSDDGMSPPPKKWKGACEFREGCNNKIIGARAYGPSVGDPLDNVGHGTHTASTAAGNFVLDVNTFELGTNVASGIAPKAHLAMYKVCDMYGCNDADILAGMDDAVKDGVDVLSLSIGGASQPYDEDPIAISTFNAIEKGIVVICSAGNKGPYPSTLSNEAPWILTVAASSVDRSFRSMIRLGNNKTFDGETLYQPANFTSDAFPLIFPGANSTYRADCLNLNSIDLKGMIVVCRSGNIPTDMKSRKIEKKGGVGMINVNAEVEGYTITVSNSLIPTVHVSYADGLDIVSYIRSIDSPTASITFGGTLLGTSPSPTVAYFSSRGPSKPSPKILKPDISAPGLNILAAWHTKVDVSEGKFGYNVISGTSMATPHVSGIVALLKSLHPDWSPAAIKSAIMTTSDINDRQGNPIKDEKHDYATFYAEGAGHVNPSKVVKPGLVYDIDVNDYIALLCNMGLGDSRVGAIVRRPSTSCSGVKNVSELDLNYPSITVPFTSGLTTITRTVTNVGSANSKYSLEVDMPKSVLVSVEPETLQFSKVNEKKTFRVTVSTSKSRLTLIEGSLKWVSGEVVVRSPLIIINNVKSSP